MTWRWRIRSWWSRKQLDRNLADEIHSHLEMRAQELEESGMSASEARSEARRRFGNRGAIAEAVRDHHAGRRLEAFAQDVRYACRVLRREPGFAAAVIVTLALAIGANGAVFSLIDAALLRPLPFLHPEQLVFLWGRDARRERTLISPADLADWRKATSFAGLSSLMGQSVNLTGTDRPARIVGAFVSPEYFRLLGVKAALGRTFNDREGRAGGDGVTVLSYGLWQARFGSDPSLLGRSVILNGEPFTVIGIMPRTFTAPFFTPDVWLPPHFYPGYTTNREQRCVVALGRLAPGTTLDGATKELEGIAQQLGRAYPETNRDRGVTILHLRDVIVEDLRPVLIALAAALLCLLLIACANVANLFLSKADGRRNEIRLRAALGAGTGRLVQQLLTESLVLALNGAIGGIAVAYAVERYVVAKLSSWPEGVSAGLNLAVLGFMAAITCVTALLFGLAPALMARHAAAQTLRTRSGWERTPLRSALAIGQVALALVMLIGSGLLIDSLQRLLNVNTGFDGSHVLSMEYRLPANKCATAAQQTHFHEEVVDRLQKLPDVMHAAIVRGLPFSGNGGTVEIGLPDREAPPPGAPYIAFYNAVTPAYFETAGIPLRAGRSFARSDHADAPRVVVVSESFARRFWPGRDATGRQVLIPQSDPGLAPGKVPLIAATIVGVVGNVRHDRLDEPEIPQLYVPYAQDPITFATIVVRTSGNPLNHVKDIQRAVWSIDKDQPLWKIRTLASLVEASLGPRRLLLSMLGWFSGVALLLAALGLYAVISYQTSQRTTELGIRTALGAGPGALLRMVVRHGLLLTLAGVGAGTVLAPLLAQALHNQLYGVDSVDLPVYALFSALLIVIGVAAVLPPAIRAARIDPVEALRAE